MPLRRRKLKVTLRMASGDVVLDETLDIRVKIHKDALAVQHTCTLEAYNLTQNLRAQLLSQFTAWNKRAVESNKATFGGATNPYVNITVEAGYNDGKSDVTAVLFEGQVVEVSPTSYPPNLSVRIECYTQQVNRLKWNSGQAPTNVTFKEYVQWAGEKMGVSSVVCETSMNDSKVWNQSASTHTIGDLLIDIQDAYKGTVVAYIDNNVLYVRDMNKIVSASGHVTVKEFIGTPLWTTWGVEFQTLFDPNITLTCAVKLNSTMNPSLNSEFIIISIDYELSSRDLPFYVKGYACPPAS